MVLFVCRGNVGRSQMAEALFNTLSKGKDVAISAGTRVVREGSNKEGQKLKYKSGAEEAIVALQEIGIDASENVRNQLTPEMLAEADKVIVMAQPETIPEYLAKSNKAIYWNVPDPHGQSLEFTRKVRNQLQDLVGELIKELV